MSRRPVMTPLYVGGWSSPSLELRSLGEEGERALEVYLLIAERGAYLGLLHKHCRDRLLAYARKQPELDGLPVGVRRELLRVFKRYPPWRWFRNLQPIKQGELT